LAVGIPEFQIDFEPCCWPCSHIPTKHYKKRLLKIQNFKLNFLNDQGSAEGKKIALKSPARALSNGTVYLFRQ
jgi:hypothetical protein